MAPIKVLSKSICPNFFRVVVNDGGQPTDYFRCQCGTLRKQSGDTGYSNLLSHVRKEHPDFAVTMAASYRSGALTAFVDSKSQNVYDCLDLMVECNLPFSLQRTQRCASA
ncbi:hypothetical protein PR002_g7574 [Phytophthora rubi]|uniref:BED-type domain-containing protein n=1 Tax=Phytophthora rubi TaxID=129364 RepID=A0A6A3N395_9STRA|nr:hypothetical protein PR002_g7574 [Phytophthora rubi]